MTFIRGFYYLILRLDAFVSKDNVIFERLRREEQHYQSKTLEHLEDFARMGKWKILDCTRITNHSPELVSVNRVKVQAKGLSQNGRNRNLQVSKFHL